MDLSQAEAVMDLIHARSERALAAAHAQLRGSLGRRMGGLIDALLAVLARIEAYIDFPDEDLPAEDRALVAREVDRIAAETDRLLATSHYGEVLRDGIKTVIVGEPNVGKSSLLNRLVGRDRALVSPEPGTTRDFIEERILLGPHWLRLIDTAGLNSSPAPLEALGMAKTRERLAEADLVLIVVDASRPSGALAPEITKLINGGKALLVLNKSDLGHNFDQGLKNFRGKHFLRVSALTGAGIDDLCGAISELVEQFSLESREDMVAINARHSKALREANAGLSAAQAKLEADEPMELLASELRGV